MKDPVTKLIILMIFFIALILGCAIIFSSCQVLKTRKASNKDTVFVSRIDSGGTKRSETTSDKQSQYEKITYVYPPRDTNIIKLYPSTSVYPSSIVYEKGSAVEQLHTFNFDSAWKARTDSLAVHTAQIETLKKVKSLSTFQIILICVGALFFIEAIKYLTGRLTWKK